MVRTRKNLYVVYAGTTEDGCLPVYETTKREKAERYLHKVVLKNTHYDKCYIDCIHGSVYDKRSAWREK